MVNLLDKILKVVLILLTISLYLYADNQKKGKNNMNEFMALLEEEIESGVSISCEGGEGVGVEIDITYYKLSSQFFNKKLEEKGFKFLTESEFTQKVLKIFKIDLKKTIQIIDIADISMEYEDEFPSAQAEGGIGLKAFDKKNGLITNIYRLPEIINYQKYQKLNLLEKSNANDFNENENDCNIYWWKDFYEDINIDEKINSEVENIIALNNYLFYNQGNIDKLFKDNHYFFSHLVLSNNYYTDLNLLEKVLDDVIDNTPNDFGKLLWRYSQKNELLINERAFNIILKKSKEKKKRFLKQMKVEKNNLYKQSMNKEDLIRLKRILENALN